MVPNNKSNANECSIGVEDTITTKSSDMSALSIYLPSSSEMCALTANLSHTVLPQLPYPNDAYEIIFSNYFIIKDIVMDWKYPDLFVSDDKYTILQNSALKILTAL